MSVIKVTPLGGAGEIGKNCTVVETENDLIIVDCGISFPHEEHHGVDIVIPDFTYILENQDRLRGIFITHAHEDHIGALSFLLPHVKVPVYASPLTEAFIRTRLEERIKMVDVDIQRFSPAKPIKISEELSVEAIRVTHSIPETSAIAVHTPHGAILFTADFKFDLSPVDQKLTDLQRLAALGDEGVLLLLSDSTNIEREGWSPSESDCANGIRKVMSKATGRVLVTMFSSNVHRMQQIADVSKEQGRVLAVAGRRMENTFQMCRRMGYLNIPDSQIIPIDQVSKYQPHEVTVIVTGSQGEERAALSQMSRAEYSRLKVKEGDTIIYSARPIPGNEGVIWRTVNRLVKLGADVHIDYVSDVHSSGHGHQDEIKMMYRLTKPFYVAPVHGEPRHQKFFAELLDGLHHPVHRRFILSNGDPLCMDDQKAWVDEPIQVGEVYIDQHSNAEVTEAILRQRTNLANEGVMVLNFLVNTDEGSLESKPKITTHGFIGDQDALEDILDDLCGSIARLSPAEIAQLDFFKATVEDLARKITFRRTGQKPVIMATITPF